MTIHVRNWEKFQHADVTKRKMRAPVWIRLYTELGSKEEYRALTMHQRGVLMSIWIEYARSGRQLSDNTATLTRQLGQRVTTRDLTALEAGGFITREAHADTHATTPRQLGDNSVTGGRENADTAASFNQDEGLPPFRQVTVTPPSSLEERRGEQTLKKEPPRESRGDWNGHAPPAAGVLVDFFAAARRREAS